MFKEVDKLINTILEAIAVTLQAEFGDGYEVLLEEKKENMLKPCFLLQCTNSIKKPYLRKGYFRQNQFCIQFIPISGEQEQSQSYAAAERLFSCLKCLTVDDHPVTGTNMKYEMTNGVLHFFVNYDKLVYERNDLEPAMEGISSKTKVKNDDEII